MRGDKTSLISEDPVGRNSTRGVSEDPLHINCGSRVFEDLVRSGTSPCLIENKVFSTPGVQKLH